MVERTKAKADGKAKERKEASRGGRLQFCSFLLAERLYGVEILKVKEITGETSFTPIFHAPPEVKGYVNIRGQINLVLDLRRLLGLDPGAVDASSRVVLFKQDIAEPFGVLVDRIGDVVEADEATVEWREPEAKPQDAAARSACDSIEIGVCKLERRLLTIIDPAKAIEAVQEKAAI